MKPVDYRVYLVLDPDLCGGLAGMLRVTQAALAGGAGVVQLRAPQWKKRQWVEAGLALLPLCRAAGVPLIINDHVDVALAVGADGVHVGQQDLPVALVRQLMGPDALVGLSVSDAAELAALEGGAVDYLGVGPVFATTSKPDAAPALGLPALKHLMPGPGVPLVAIGGIAQHNAADLIACGIDGLAVISAICAAANPEAATRELVSLFGVNA
ncbi:thiamine phosphate synthase [Aquitalea sp. S1-19]|nr:thiamine phosphate synthase [Aquitalea sp. S1-19]